MIIVGPLPCNVLFQHCFLSSVQTDSRFQISLNYSELGLKSPGSGTHRGNKSRLQYLSLISTMVRLNNSVHLFLKGSLSNSCYLMNTIHLLYGDNIDISYILSDVTGVPTFSHLFNDSSNYFSQRTNITVLYIMEKGNSQVSIDLLAITTL